MKDKKGDELKNRRKQTTTKKSQSEQVTIVDQRVLGNQEQWREDAGEQRKGTER